MARVQGADEIYNLAAQFEDRCLAGLGSLLWPGEKVWTEDNITQLWDAFIGHPDESKRSFLDKWREQLADCSEEVHMVATDVYVIYHLGVWQGAVGQKAKLRNIRSVISWKLVGREPNLAPIQEAFTVGLAHPGRLYLQSGRPWQIAFYLEFARQLKRQSTEPSDRANCQRLADDVNAQLTAKNLGNTSFARHFLLHLLFPDFYENIVSTPHKEKIAVKWSSLAGGAEDLDEQIYNIRRELSKTYGEGFHFYSTEIRPLWDNGQSPTGTDPVLEKIATLLEARALDDPDVRQHSWWAQNIVPITRPFLQQVAQALGSRQVKYHTGGDAGKKRDSLDRLNVPLQSANENWGDAGGITASVCIGFPAEPDKSYSERRLSWGAYSWPRKEHLDEVSAAIEQATGPNFELTRIDGYKAAHWPGSIVAAFRSLTPDELRQRRAGELAVEIAGDLRGIIDRVGERNDPPKGNGHPNGTDQLADLAAETYLSLQELREIKQLLEEKKQIILEGPPGAGKTFVADKFARYFTGNPLSGSITNQQLEIVQFHQSYGYEDFIEGIRPVTSEGRIEYRVLPGVFLDFCLKAMAESEKNFVIIIDEINRGNISRIFGELLYLLEYRSESVRLPYSKELFQMPTNVYVIGTMNTTDRSLALIDYALRRRFYFHRLGPVRNGDAPVLRGWLERQRIAERDTVLRLFLRLNEQVERQIDEHHQIGHSYLMRDEIGSGAVQRQVWQRAIIPLLEEYFHPRKSRSQLETEFGIDALLSNPGASPAADAVDES